MKFQCGLCYTNDRRATDSDLSDVLGDYSAWDAETSGEMLDGPLLLGFRGDRITYEEDTEIQPFRLGPLIISFDGRVDNREDLAAGLGLIPDRKLSDPALVAQAYERHGDAVFSRLLGEFALVLWRSDTRVLTFVRSVDGARPLYYSLEDKKLLWSSDIAHLVRISAQDPQINDKYILEYLISDPMPHRTPFIGIHPIKPGTALRFAKERFTSETRLWEPREIQPLRFSSDAEYEQSFRSKITEAVKVRLRAKGTVFSELSGGLDSSSLVLVGDQILKASNKNPSTLQTLSTVYDQSTTCDERYFIKLVEEARGIPSTYVHEHEQNITLGLSDITFTGIPNNFDATPGRFSRFADYMKQSNARILLTGIGGDHIFCSTTCPEILVADLVREGRLAQAHDCCKLWSRCMGTPYFALLFKKALPLAISSVFCRPAKYKFVSEVPWLDIDAQRSVLSMLSVFNTNESLAPSMSLRLWMLDALFRTVSTGRWNSHPALYISHPYTHRPLVEFCLATPITQFVRQGTSRSLLSRSLSDLLPLKVARRRGKGSINEALARAVQRDWNTFGDLANWQVCVRGYVKHFELAEALHSLKGGFYDKALGVLRVIMVERFLRSLSHARVQQRSVSGLASLRGLKSFDVAVHSLPLKVRCF